LNDDREDILYKAVHFNHPCTVWTRTSKQNYKYLYDLFCALCDEYTFRYKRIHETDMKLRSALWVFPNNIPDIGFTEPPQAMPDYCKVVGNPIQAYHNYYINEKSRFAKWKLREQPRWYK